MANEVTALFPTDKQLVLAFAGGRLYEAGSTGDKLIQDFNTNVYQRLAGVKYLDAYFCTSDFIELFMVKDGQVTEFQKCEMPLPTGRFVEFFMDRVVVGRIANFMGETAESAILFSDRADYGLFEEKATNEATRYDLTPQLVSSENVTGLTGLKAWGNVLYAYTPNSIELIQYVGQPWVLRKETLPMQIGNCFPYAVVNGQFGQYFVSCESVYVTTSGGVQEVGQAVSSFLFNDLSEVDEQRYKMWGAYDPVSREVFWVYASKTGNGELDSKIVYNESDQQWTTSKCENLHSHARVTVRSLPLTIDDLSGAIDNQVGNIDNLVGEAGIASLSLWGTADRKVLRDETVTDNFADFVDAEEPYLETGDLFFEDLHNRKEVNGVLINADYDENTCDGVEVFISTRDKLDEEVVWVSKGLWTKDIKTKIRTFSPVNGIVFRFKFLFKEATADRGVRNAKFSAWGLVGLTTLANR